MEDPANDILWFKSGENYYKYENDTLYAFVKEDDILVKYTNESILEKPSNLEKYLISIFSDGRYIIDNKSNIWIKEPSALQKLVGTSFERFDINTKFIPDINAITEDPNGNIWLSTRRFGLVKISEGKNYYFNKDSALLGDNVYLTYTDSKENIWFCTDKGVNIYDGKSFIHYSEDTAKIIHRITSIIEPDDSTIWLSSFKGHVSCFDGKAWYSGHTKTIYFAHPASDGSGALAALIVTPLAVEEFPTLLIKDTDNMIYLMDFYTNTFYRLERSSDSASLIDLSIAAFIPYIKEYKIFDPSVQGWTLSYLTHFRLSRLCNKLIEVVPKNEMQVLFTENSWLIHVDHEDNLWFNRIKPSKWARKYSLVKCSRD